MAAIERIAHDIFSGEIGEAFNELVIDFSVHVDAFDAAAALAGIVERAIDQIFDRVVELGVGPHIGGVLAAELKPDRGERARGSTLDGAAAGNRAGKIDVVDPSRADQLLGLLMGHDQIVKETLGQASAPKRLGQPLAYQQRLRGVLQDDRIAGEQTGHDGVDRGEIRIVPRRDDHHDADRIARDIAAEAHFFRRVVRPQHLLGHCHDGARTLLDASLFAAIANGPSHLPGKLDGDVVVHPQQRVQEGENVTTALSDGNGLPRRQRGAGRRHCSLDVGVPRDRPLGID